jgi:hypothetical protein
MRGAPPVQVACGQEVRWLWFIRGLHAVTFASLVGWLALQSEVRMPLLGLLVVSAAVGAGLLPPTQQPQGAAPVLSWDGQRWLWQDQPAEVAVMLDFDRWLLMRVSTLQRHHWVALAMSAGDVPAALFKAALQAHAGRAPRGDD